MSLSFFHTYDSIYALVFTFPILKPVFRIIFLQTVFSTFYAIQFPVSLSLLHTHTSILCYLFTFLILKPGVLLCFSNISCKHSHSGSECDSWQRATGFFSPSLWWATLFSFFGGRQSFLCLYGEEQHNECSPGSKTSSYETTTISFTQ